MSKDIPLPGADRKIMEELLVRVKSGQLTPPPVAQKQYEKYFDDPIGYINKVLKVTLTSDQERICNLVPITPKLLIKAGNSLGKTHIEACLALWFYDCRVPSKIITTAPTQQQVEDLLWGELRRYCGKRIGLLPSKPELNDTDQHYINGFTARDANSFQGRHAKNLLVVFDEAVGIDYEFWVAADGMLSDPIHNHWLACCNPTDISSAAFQLTQATDTDWHVETLSCFNHPNVLEGLKWLEHHDNLSAFIEPIPGATSLQWINQRIKLWCMPIRSVDKTKTDIEWPPASGMWYRPGPEFQARVMGLWPTSATTNIWSDSLWESINPTEPFPMPDEPPEIGCDISRYGGDKNVFHVRRGNVSLLHEGYAGWDTGAVCGYLKQLCNKFGNEAGIEGNRVLVKIDDTGDRASNIIDNMAGYKFRSIKSSNAAKDPKKYPNKRSESWFLVRDYAETTGIDISRLPKEAKENLRVQLMSPLWKFDAQGRAVVEPKDLTKSRLGRSPDDADGFNLAYIPAAPALEPFYLGVGNPYQDIPWGDWQRQRILTNELY